MKNKPIALTFDLELWHEGEWLKKYITPEIAGKDMLEESVSPLLDTLKRKNFTATFFVTDEVARKYPATVRKINAAGHEIASHGVRHTQLRNIPPHEFDRLLGEHVARLESITGKKPKGFRAPHFSLDQDTKWVLPILAKHGFKYDSSIFPLKTPEYGVQGAPLDPYMISFTDIISEDPSSPMLEIPATIYAASYAPSIKLPIGGGIYFRLLPLWIFTRMFHAATNKRSLPTLYFHPHELCAGTPRIKGPFLKTMLKYWGMNTSLEKFESLTNKFTFYSIENIVNA